MIHSNNVDMLASYVRDCHDADHVKDNHNVGRPQDRQDDWTSISQGDSTHRRRLQLVLDLRQPDLPIPQRGIHSDAKGWPKRTLFSSREMCSYVIIQACTPVAVLLAGWAMGVQKPDLKVLFNVSVIVVGVVIASIGEIKFVLIGVLFQIGGIIFEAIRLVMVERLLSSAEYKMDPLVSLYYFAPVCAFMNFCVALVFELPRIQLEEVYHVGLWNLFGNGCLAFALNVSVVFLVCLATASLRITYQVLT